MKENEITFPAAGASTHGKCEHLIINTQIIILIRLRRTEIKFFAAGRPLIGYPTLSAVYPLESVLLNLKSQGPLKIFFFNSAVHPLNKIYRLIPLKTP